VNQTCTKFGSSGGGIWWRGGDIGSRRRRAWGLDPLVGRSSSPKYGSERAAAMCGCTVGGCGSGGGRLVWCCNICAPLLLFLAVLGVEGPWLLFWLWIGVCGAVVILVAVRVIFELWCAVVRANLGEAVYSSGALLQGGCFCVVMGWMWRAPPRV
jgi:hypothetical protein